MYLPNREDAIHKMWLLRVLTAIADDDYLATVLRFKGGTCAAMLGWLDRFSVDLDFDFVGSKEEVPSVRAALKKVFIKLDLDISDESKSGIQFFLKYPQSTSNKRNTLKIDTFFPPLGGNRYEDFRLQEIDRIFKCQTKETMFANKMIALQGRFEKNGSVAGRDLYDIHYFFSHGYDYISEIIEQYSGEPIAEFLKQLLELITEKVTQRVIDQDINFLLRPEDFARIRKVLKPELQMFLKDEIQRLEK